MVVDVKGVPGCSDTAACSSSSMDRARFSFSFLGLGGGEDPISMASGCIGSESCRTPGSDEAETRRAFTGWSEMRRAVDLESLDGTETICSRAWNSVQHASASDTLPGPAALAACGRAFSSADKGESMPMFSFRSRKYLCIM